MQPLNKFSAIVVSACLLMACSGSTSSSAGKDSVADHAPTSGNSSTGDASFSATIDGTNFSGKEINEMQLTNTAFIYPASENSPKRLLFFLNSDKKGDDFCSIRFSIPDQEGVYKFTHETDKACHCSLQLDNNLRSTDNFSRYDQDSVTVSIDKITSTRISGTFSGRLRLSDDTRSKQYKRNVVVTDGKFNIPFSTGNLRPE